MAWPTDRPCVKKVFGVCHVDMLRAPLQVGTNVSRYPPRTRTSALDNYNLQRSGAEEIEPSPSTSGRWERDQISIALCCCFLLTGLIGLEDSSLSDSL